MSISTWLLNRVTSAYGSALYSFLETLCRVRQEGGLGGLLCTKKVSVPRQLEFELSFLSLPYETDEPSVYLLPVSSSQVESLIDGKGVHIEIKGSALVLPYGEELSTEFISNVLTAYTLKYDSEGVLLYPCRSVLGVDLQGCVKVLVENKERVLNVIKGREQKGMPLHASYTAFGTALSGLESLYYADTFKCVRVCPYVSGVSLGNPREWGFFSTKPNTLFSPSDLGLLYSRADSSITKMFDRMYIVGADIDLHLLRNKKVLMIGQPPVGWGTQRFLERLGKYKVKVYRGYKEGVDFDLAFYNPNLACSRKVLIAQNKRMPWIPYEEVTSALDSLV